VSRVDKGSDSLRMLVADAWEVGVRNMEATAAITLIIGFEPCTSVKSGNLSVVLF